MDSSTVICWTNTFVILGVSGIGSILLLLFYFGWKILIANNVDPDQMPHFVASDLGLHCLPMTLSWFTSKNGLNWKNMILQYSNASRRCRLNGNQSTLAPDCSSQLLNFSCAPNKAR